jgi:hypothetical protein
MARVRAVEQMPYRGESARDRHAFAKYLEEVKRGKSLLALIAMRNALTPEIRACWHEGTFGTIETSQGAFDELTCNLSYHFGKHGERYGTIANMTAIAKRYFNDHRAEAREEDGMLRFPNGSIFTPSGLIVTFI